MILAEFPLSNEMAENVSIVSWFIMSRTLMYVGRQNGKTRITTIWFCIDYLCWRSCE